MLIRKTVCGFADFRERADIVCRKFVFHDEPSQCVALPSRAVLRPFEYLLKDRHCFSLEITRNSNSRVQSVETPIVLRPRIYLIFSNRTSASRTCRVLYPWWNRLSSS